MRQTSRDNSIKKLSNIKRKTKIEEYLEEEDFLKNARANAESLKIPIIDDETGRFLELASYLSKPSKILEIGCGTGYSTYFLLKSILTRLNEDISGKCSIRSVEPDVHKDNALESFNGKCKTVESSGGSYSAAQSVRISNKEVISKIQFSYTGIDLNRERLGQACLFIGSLIEKTIRPCLNGKRIKNIIESENFHCSFEFIHGNAVKIIQAQQETEEKYDLVFIDAAKYQYPCYLEAVRDKLNTGCPVIADNIFYDGKIFLEETLRHDANSVAGIQEYLRIIAGDSAFETSLFNIGDGIAISIYNKEKKWNI
jgi:predicted O-methyltransferase YrrM